MNKTLNISTEVKLPLDAVTQKIALLGMSGSGKTNTMTVFAEEMLDARVQIVLLDPKGEAYGLRLAHDGKNPGYPIPVFGGEHADVPLRPEMGKRVAEIIVKNDYSAILDLSEFIPSELARFGYDFATALLHLKKHSRSAMCLMIDEAQDFVPENPQPAKKGHENYEPRMLHAFQRLQKQGRSSGIGMVIAGQRPQEISKKVLNLCECWITFRMAGIQERDTTIRIIGETDIEAAKALKVLLPKLETGSAYFWSAYWLKVSGVYHVREKRTFDSAATPEVGARRVEPRKLSPVDIKTLSEAMQDVIEKAKESDPAELKKQLSQARRDIFDLQTKLACALEDESVVERVYVPVLADGQLKELQSLVAELTERGEVLSATGEEIKMSAERISDEISKVRAQQTAITSRPASQAPTPANRETVRRSRKIEPTVSSNGVIQPRQQKVLDALRELEVLGIKKPARSTVAVFAGRGPSSSSYTNDLGYLRTLGFVDYPSGGILSLTDEGRAAGNPPESRRTLGEFHQAWFTHLEPRKVDVLKVLIRHYPRPVGRETLAVEAGRGTASSSYTNDLGALRSLGIADYPGAGLVVATALLFPAGLKP